MTESVVPEIMPHQAQASAIDAPERGRTACVEDIWCIKRYARLVKTVQQCRSLHA